MCSCRHKEGRFEMCSFFFLVLRDVWEAKYSNKLPAVVTSCNMLKRSLERREVENRPVFERSLLLRRFLGSRDDREALFTESRDATGKTVNLDTDKTRSDNFG